MNSTGKPLIDAAIGLKPSRYPVWFMRQAGRYLPEYRAVRADHDFVAMCKSPELSAEVTLQPLRRFDLDAAIIFSDILIPCIGMGQTLTFDKGHGPELNSPIRTLKNVSDLIIPNAEKDLGFVGDAIALTKSKLRKDQTMIGFAGAPFTVASYMIEGKGSKDFTEVKKLIFRDPAIFTNLLEKLAETTILYLKMQINAGADIVMLFDTWAGQLTPDIYRTMVFPVTNRILSAIKQEMKIPVIYYPGQGSDKMYELSNCSADVISVDWRTRLGQAGKILREVGLNVTLQGNLDPQALLAPEHVLRKYVNDLKLEAINASRNHIFNVGHGLLPHIPPESISTVIDELRKC
ncbi:MAG: uroporphyrinogen decarboxylase [Proteobacteria bacterium]|nr:uroporphyrinogen decarboxylase [Pseudomonadota bacterium]